MKFIVLSCITVLILFTSCLSTKPRNDFDSYQRPGLPDYSLKGYWAALPDRLDAADSTPAGLKDLQAQSQADVFFLYPTSYLPKKGNDQWNASLDDAKINLKTDATSITYQASIFNEVGKIYAPRYRQAHYHVFFTDDTVSAKKALDLAYQDIKTAFDYYLKNFNNGRPIILAGHSQGAAHLIRLLKEYFDNDSLRRKLVVAYVIGYPVLEDYYTYIKPCSTKFENHCICSWRSFKIGYKNKILNNAKPVIVTNPLSWDTQADVYIDKSKNLGSVLDDIQEAPRPGLSGAQIYKNILWIDKPKFKNSFLYFGSNFHVGDLNIFYMNVRQNATDRLSAFWK